jgi:hypothetical protein
VGDLAFELAGAADIYERLSGFALREGFVGVSAERGSCWLRGLISRG